MSPRAVPVSLACMALVAASILCTGAAVARPNPPARIATPSRALDTDYSAWLEARQVGMFVSNLGSIAHDDVNGTGGFEFPLGSGHTLLYAAGLWVGAKVAGSPRVTTAEYLYEFGPGAMVAGAADNPTLAPYHLHRLRRAYASAVTRDSALAAWNAMAVPYGAPPVELQPDGRLGLRCDEITWCVYNDADPSRHIAMGSAAPLGIEVRQTAFAWNQDGPIANTAFVEYWIVNRGSNTLDSTHVALWADPDVGAFSDDYAGCDTTLDMAYAYNAANTDAVYGIPPAVGLVLIRGPVRAPGDTLHMTAARVFTFGLDPQGPAQCWNSLLGRFPDGTLVVNPQTLGTTTFQYPGDPVAPSGWVDAINGDVRILLASGPFTLAPGDSQRILVAIVAGQGSNRLGSVANLRDLASLIRDFVATNHDSITATLASLIRADAAPGRVHIEWRTSAGERARLWRRPPGGEWEARAELVADGHGVVTLEDRDVVAGARLGYVLGLMQPDGSEVRSGEVWVDVPATPALAIEGLRPNPAAGVPRASFVLEDDSPATLELIDVAGRCVLARDVGALGTGHHVLPLGTGALRPGLWFLRLTQRGRSVAARAVVVR